MASMLSFGDRAEGNIEVHRYYGGTVIAASFLALLLQAFLHKYGRWAELVDLPLLVTIYFGVSKRNPVSGRRRSRHQQGRNFHHPADRGLAGRVGGHGAVCADRFSHVAQLRMRSRLRLPVAAVTF